MQAIITQSAICGCGRPVTKYKKLGLCGTCYARQRRAQNPQPHRDSSRRYREANPERIRERRRSPETREYNRQWKAANRGKLSVQRRARYAANREQERANIRRKGMTLRHGSEVFAVSAAMREEQQGKCYLCGIYLVPELAFIDHDHRCCPRGRSCAYCRRGLACDFCNTLIGMAHDDPGTLRLIADNLEAKLVEIDERLAGKPQQPRLVPDGAL